MLGWLWAREERMIRGVPGKSLCTEGGCTKQKSLQRMCEVFAGPEEWNRCNLTERKRRLGVADSWDLENTLRGHGACREVGLGVDPYCLRCSARLLSALI